MATNADFDISTVYFIAASEAVTTNDNEAFRHGYLDVILKRRGSKKLDSASFSYFNEIFQDSFLD
jgi:hypothetical protein